MRANEVPAAPLVQSKNRLVSAPLEHPDELGEGIWIIEDGEWRALSNGKFVDVSGWIDVGQWSVPTTSSLGDVPEAPLVLAPVDLDLRLGSGVGAPDAKWQTIWERGGNGLMSEFAPGYWLSQASRLVTPPREVNGKVIASDGSIVLSAALVLGGALLFFLSSLAGVTGAKWSSGTLMTLVITLAAVAVWRRQKLQAAGQTRAIPLFVVSDKVKIAAILLFVLGMVRVAFASPESLDFVWTLFIIALVAARTTALVGRLVGTQPVGAQRVPVSPSGAGSGNGAGWLARWMQARLKSRALPTGVTSKDTSLWGRLFGKKGEPGPPQPDPLGDAWRRLLAQGALQSGLFKQLGRAQARYLLRSMELFERGDLEAALRHAIALGAKSDEGRAAPPALGLPNARDDLNLSLFGGAARGSFNFGPEIESKLRALYRRAFERLRDTGDWQKAAFVLADLLQNAEEAVAFLEEQGQYELAAKLAEGRNLAPGLVVRAWWLAGNRERAIQIARLKEAFADAVTRLERDPKRKDDAAAMRLLWGQHLAELGRFAPAVEAVWPVEAGRPLAQKWLRLGLNQHTSPRLVARALSIEPGAWNEWRPFLDALWTCAHDENGARERETLARELVNQKNESNVALQVAARQTARAVLNDGARGLGGIEKASWDNLLSLSGDGILRADSKWPQPKAKPSAFPTSGEALEIRVQGEPGTMRARDAILLPGGELLVALGEIGARLLARNGKTRAHFDVPAHEIVRAFDAPRALLLAHRDETIRVAKLDLSSRQTSLWGDIRADCFADSFDGATWLAASDGRIRAFDMTGGAPSSLWDSGDLGGHASKMAISRASLAVLVERRLTNEAKCESWRFELPSLILRERRTPVDFLCLFTPNSSRYVNAFARQFDVAIADNEMQSLTWAPEKAAVPIETGAQTIHDVRFSTQTKACCFAGEMKPVRSPRYFARIRSKSRRVCDLWARILLGRANVMAVGCYGMIWAASSRGTA